MGVSVVALAGETKPAPPQEPVGFVTGGIIGGFAAGPIGAVIGAGIGTWLGNRVHRAGEAAKAEAQVAALQTDKMQLQTETGALLAQKHDLTETNQALMGRLTDLSRTVDAARSANEAAAQEEAAQVLDGLQGDVLFRTGSAEIAPEMAQGIGVLAEAVAKSPALKVRVDGYADARGTAAANLELSEARANAVRDLFLAAGVSDASLEVNAFGKSRSVADDPDGRALERRVRLTLQAEGASPVARSETNSPADRGGGAGDAGGRSPTGGAQPPAGNE